MTDTTKTVHAAHYLYPEKGICGARRNERNEVVTLLAWRDAKTNGNGCTRCG